MSKVTKDKVSPKVSLKELIHFGVIVRLFKESWFIPVDWGS